MIKSSFLVYGGNMIYPSFIDEKDTIGISAPSDGVVDEVKVCRLDNAINNFKKLGFNILETANVRSSINGRSSSPLEQARQLEWLYTNNDVKAIMCVGGGDFLLEMLPHLDLSVIENNPKLIQGYSDPTGLLYTITTNLDLATICGDNFKSFGMNPWHKSLSNNLEILKGNIISQTSFSKYESEGYEEVSGDEVYKLDSDVYWNIITNHNTVDISGRIIGGCIDVLSDLFGTKYDKTVDFIEKYKDDGIIWYFDNFGLSSEHLIRTLWKFKENGWFKYTKGIIFGRSMTLLSYNDISFEEAIIHSLGDLDVPIITNADIGHVPPRLTIINGAISNIKVENGKGKIEFSLK